MTIPPDAPAGRSCRAALEVLCVEMAWRVDHSEASSVHELFSEDGELELGPSVSLRGRDAIAEWGRQRDTRQEVSVHLHSNFRCRATSTTTAEGTNSVVVYAESAAPSVPGRIVVGEYRDELVLIGDEWRFRARSYRTLMSGTLSRPEQRLGERGRE